MIFAIQDGLSLHLSSAYNVYMVVMVRYWFFAAFVMTVSAKQAGGLRNAARTKQPLLQGFRGVLLATEISVMVTGFTFLGLVESLAIFSAYTLIVAALSGPILGETVGWRRWLAIGVGFCGRVDHPKTRNGSLFTLCNHSGDGGLYVRTLQPAHPLCCPLGQHGHKFFLDWRDGLYCDDNGWGVSF